LTLRIVILIIGLLTLFLSNGCRPGLTLSDESADGFSDIVLAQADSNLVLTADDFFQRISGSKILMNGGTIGEDESRFLLDSVMLDTLAGLAAPEVRLRDHFTGYSIYQHQYYDYLVYRYWQETLYKLVTVDSLEALEFFYEHPDLFSVEEQVNLYHLLVSPYGLTIGPDSSLYKSITRDELWEATRERAHNLKKLLDWGEPFQNVAYDFSHDANSQRNGGHVGWTKRGIYLDPFDSVAFSLDIGEYSEPYRDKDGWHLVYIDGHIEDGPIPIDSPGVFLSAMQTVLTDKSNKILEARLDSLRQHINVVANPLIMHDTINIHLVMDSVWTGVLNNRDTISTRQLKRYEEGFRKKYKIRNTTPEIKLEMLRQASERFIQVQAARLSGIDTLPDVVAEAERIRHLKQKAVVQSKSYSYTWEPDPAAVDEYYYEHIDDYVYGKPLKVVAFVAKDSAFAEFLREQASSGAEFKDIAREHGGGVGTEVQIKDLGRIGPGDLSRVLYRTALLTREGTVSKVVRDKAGDYWCFKIVEHKESIPVEHARGGIRQTMKEDHALEVWQEYRDELYRKFHVTFPGKISEIILGNYHVRSETKDL
jgi:hypothetical protein